MLPVYRVFTDLAGQLTHSGELGGHGEWRGDGRGVSGRPYGVLGVHLIISLGRQSNERQLR